eukprot:TRINITY_DN6285_c0_g1_i1.p1 TRINITY_DN6285_c0_g1~~TRINITY_DN6285_c0_g1_i1.p1  ORF type:complete len:454 (-),score=80.04 TRINITY_DN6285_c0_g1_i1:25-1386(-)
MGEPMEVDVPSTPSTPSWEDREGFLVNGSGNENKEQTADLSKLVIDGGASFVRLGWADPSLTNPSFIIPNFATKGKNGKKLVGSATSTLDDYTNLVMKRPHDHGYLLDWNLEKSIFDYKSRYSKFGKKFEPKSTQLLLTEPPFNPQTLRSNIFEEIFEREQFQSLLIQQPSFLSLYDYCTNHHKSSLAPVPNPVVGAVVVDSGYSFTHIVPFFDQTKLSYAVKRINVGGKLLTNYLKEIVSYRHWNMMHETYLMNHLKERLCYVPLNYLVDLELTKLTSAKNTIRRHFVLPDFITNNLGYVKESDPLPSLPSNYTGTSRPDEQVLVMNNERLIPELLFNPSDIGIREAGIAEAIVQAVEETPVDLHPLLYSAIVLSGGNTAIPGFADRLTAELRQLVPSQYAVNVLSSKDPHLSAWRGGAKIAQTPYFELNSLSIQEYNEKGDMYAMRRFSSL